MRKVSNEALIRMSTDVCHAWDYLMDAMHVSLRFDLPKKHNTQIDKSLASINSLRMSLKREMERRGIYKDKKEE